jgi:plasmid stability protein
MLVNISEKNHKLIKIYAANHGVTIQGAVNVALNEFLKKVEDMPDNTKKDII